MNDSRFGAAKETAAWAVGAVATLATAAAGIIGVLHQLGFMRDSPAPSPATTERPAVVANAPQAPLPQAILQQAAQGPGTRWQDAAPAAIANPAAAPVEKASRPPVIASNEVAKPMGKTPQSGAAQVILAGAWRDGGAGFCHLIKQVGEHVEIVNFAPVTNAFISVGHGKIDGREVRMHMNDLHPKAVTAEMFLSDDAQRLVGTVTRPDGQHPLRWHRAGAVCGPAS